MAKSVKPIPDGYHSVTPYLIIGRRKAGEAIDFYARAFNAKEIMRMPGPDGGIAHAEIHLEAPKRAAYGPDPFKGSPATLHVYVPDVDATAKQATAAGATVVRPIADQFYGDRSVGLTDPFGHRWYFATHTRDVSQEEMEHHMHASATA